MISRANSPSVVDYPSAWIEQQLRVVPGAMPYISRSRYVVKRPACKCRVLLSPRCAFIGNTELQNCPSIKRWTKRL